MHKHDHGEIFHFFCLSCFVVAYTCTQFALRKVQTFLLFGSHAMTSVDGAKDSSMTDCYPFLGSYFFFGDGKYEFFDLGMWVCHE